MVCWKEFLRWSESVSVNLRTFWQLVLVNTVIFGMMFSSKTKKCHIQQPVLFNKVIFSMMVTIRQRNTTLCMFSEWIWQVARWWILMNVTCLATFTYALASRTLLFSWQHKDKKDLAFSALFLSFMFITETIWEDKRSAWRLKCVIVSLKGIRWTEGGMWLQIRRLLSFRPSQRPAGCYLASQLRVTY